MGEVYCAEHDLFSCPFAHRPKTWEELYKASPEAVEASRRHWYTVPGASKSGFYESQMPRGAADEYRLSFMMCQLSQSNWYSHLSLDKLAEEAEQFIAERTDAAERKRVAEARLEGHDSLKEAYAKGLDAVYTLASLSPAETKVAQYMMSGTPDEVIGELMGYKESARTKVGDTVRQQKSRVHKKLQAILKERE